MLRKLIVVGLVVAATLVALWRLGVLDEHRLKGEAADLRESAEKGAQRAAEDAARRAREAVDDRRP